MLAVQTQADAAITLVSATSVAFVSYVELSRVNFAVSTNRLSGGNLARSYVQSCLLHLHKRICHCSGANVQVAVPHQDNHYDCGLFTLSYMEFFCRAAPKQIHYVSHTKRRANGHLIMDWGPDAERGRSGEHSNFLTSQWFPPCYPSNLRHNLMIGLVEKMRDVALDGVGSESAATEDLQTQLHHAEDIISEAKRHLKEEKEECAH